jgi:hypothetical protein
VSASQFHQSQHVQKELFSMELAAMIAGLGCWNKNPFFQIATVQK